MVGHAPILTMEELAELADGAKPGTAIETAAKGAGIPKHALVAADDALGVRCRRWQWWLPGP